MPKALQLSTFRHITDSTSQISSSNTDCLNTYLLPLCGRRLKFCPPSLDSHLNVELYWQRHGATCTYLIILFVDLHPKHIKVMFHNSV